MRHTRHTLRLISPWSAACRTAAFCVALALPVVLTAQPGRVSESMVTTSSYGLYFRPHSGADVTLDNNGKNMFDGLDPESIPGPLYWNPGWAPAQLYLRDGRLLGRFPVRYNLVNGIFSALLPDGGEKVVQEEMVKTIRFDTVVNGIASATFVLADPPVSSETRNVPKGYLMRLTQGPVLLLKSMRSTLLYRDSLFGAIRKPYFAMREGYHVAYKGAVVNLRRLSFRELASAVPVLAREEEFFSERRVKWGDEAAVSQALQAWNDAHKPVTPG